MAWYEQPDRGGLYGVYDAARSAEILPALQASGEPLACLAEERTPGRLAPAMPHVVALDPARPFGQRSLVDGWASRWAIFLRASTHLQGVRRHLRRSLVAIDPSGRRLFFRFFDPRILRVFLPTCLPAELATFFGPIEAFFAFREDEDLVDIYTIDEAGKLQVESRPGPAEPKPQAPC